MAKAKEDKVLFADVELGVHVKDGEGYNLTGGAWYQPIEAKVILPGQFVVLSDLPDYVVKAAQEGKIQGGRLLSKSEAVLLQKELYKDFFDPNEDISHSDWEVSDEERRANRFGYETPEVEEVEVPESEVQEVDLEDTPEIE